MQTTEGPGFESNGRLGSTRALTAMWVLVVVSCCAALVAFAFVYVSFTRGGEVLAANPHCATPVGPMSFVRPMIERLQTAWLICGAAGLLSWSCAVIANRIASASTRGVRRTASTVLVFSSLALVGLAVSFGWYQVASFGTCIG